MQVVYICVHIYIIDIVPSHPLDRVSAEGEALAARVVEPDIFIFMFFYKR